MFVRFLAISVLLSPSVHTSVSAQSGFHPYWEIPGFDFSQNGAWRVRARQVSQLRHQLLSSGQLPRFSLRGPAAGQQSTTSVSGTMVVPAILFAYANTDSTQFMKDTAQYDAALFATTPPGGNPYTLRTLYQQLSNGALTMQGKVIGWVRLDSAETTYTGIPGTCTGNPFGTTNCNGLFSSNALARMQAGFRQALVRVDSFIDFGQFDNDGPDGIPNSGDDDGVVDMIMFAHPTKDGACGGFPESSDPSTNNHIWSHRFQLVTGGGDYITNDPAPHGNTSGYATIHVRDYFVTSALGGTSACDTTQIMPIGTAAHEFGHALSLPDLYDTGGNTQGVGEWGLMGSGNFTSPRSPSRMEAWSLNELGWITLSSLTSAGTYPLDPVATSRTAAYVRPPGPNPRGEYFLIENRQGGAAGLADSAMITRHCLRSGQPGNCPGGLLIWHVDSTKITTSGFHQTNSINSGTIHGLALQEGDGLRQLWCGSGGCNRGDAGDPYPGVSGNTAFVYRTNPNATMNSDGSFAGLGIDQITQVVSDGQMSFRLRFGALTVVSASDTNAVIQFNGPSYNVYRDLLDSTVTYTIGIADTQLSADQRRRFHFLSWSDGGAITHTITGSNAGGAITANVSRDFKLIATWPTGGSVRADTAINLAGDFIPDGRIVTLTPVDSTLNFCGWAGDTTTTDSVLALPMHRPYTVAASFGSPNTITSAGARPNGVIGATYADTLRINGGGAVAAWSVVSGALPAGLTLSQNGVISGFPRQGGNFSYTVRVVSCDTSTKAFSLSVTAPTLTPSDVLSQLLGPTAPLSADQLRYLDIIGNNNGSFDIGDFLAWVKLTNPPLSPALLQAMPRKGGRQ
ncbi:MAG TPA: M6 family metalloprotease domain-containing protein [Gemmatimonadales bacterium]|nr:M6 family metalloprotease domain-containing protein [Gemmatimonadales bacterium]